MKYFVYKNVKELERVGEEWKFVGADWKLAGEYNDINEAYAKAVELCGNETYHTEPYGMELPRAFFGRKSKETWDAMITLNKK